MAPKSLFRLTDSERSIARAYTTDATGGYMLSLLPPAVYSLQVTASGFKTYKQDGIELAAGQTAEQPVVRKRHSKSRRDAQSPKNVARNVLTTFGGVDYTVGACVLSAGCGGVFVSPARTVREEDFKAHLATS